MSINVKITRRNLRQLKGEISMKSTSTSTSTPFQALVNGELTPNEFAVLVAVQANADKNVLTASAAKISNQLNGNLSRHAVRRALRNLQNNGWILWQTSGTNQPSTIVMN